MDIDYYLYFTLVFTLSLIKCRCQEINVHNSPLDLIEQIISAEKAGEDLNIIKYVTKAMINTATNMWAAGGC